VDPKNLYAKVDDLIEERSLGCKANGGNILLSLRQKLPSRPLRARR